MFCNITELIVLHMWVISSLHDPQPGGVEHGFFVVSSDFLALKHQLTWCGRPEHPTRRLIDQ
jgi:hypothetical protein